MFRFLSQWWRLNGQSLPDRDTVPSGSKVGERQLQWSWWLGEIAYGFYINVFLNIFSGIERDVGWLTAFSQDFFLSSDHFS
jgi:hypothetical protein